MKVGILTFSSAFNFGAALQCYGLYETIKSLGHDVTVIDYRPSYLSSIKRDSSLRQLTKYLLSYVFYGSDIYLRRKVNNAYLAFEHQNMKLTKPCYDTIDLGKEILPFDYIVVGSDQVWNPRFNANDIAWYGLDGNSSPQWITYAASAGSTEFTTKELSFLKNKLANFSHISVREPFLRDMVQSLLPRKKDVPIVLDPSLLAEPSIWHRWESPIEKDNYILTYQARESDDVFRIAHEVSKQLGNIKIIPIDFYPNVESNGYKKYIASPSDFISLITNARCVITTSFHGTAFSILCKTPFYTIRLNDGADGRAENLLQQVGLSNRMIHKHERPKFEPIVFNTAHECLAVCREYSLNYLKQSLV